MEELHLVTHVERPVEDVFDFVVQPENLPRYSSMVVAARRTSPGPIRLGSTATLGCRVLGHRFEMTGRVTEFEPCRRFATETMAGPFQLEARLAFEPDARGTLIASVFRGESRGVLRLADPVVLAVARAQFRAFAARLKTVLASC